MRYGSAARGLRHARRERGEAPGTLGMSVEAGMSRRVHRRRWRRTSSAGGIGLLTAVPRGDGRGTHLAAPPPGTAGPSRRRLPKHALSHALGGMATMAVLTARGTPVATPSARFRRTGHDKTPSPSAPRGRLFGRPEGAVAPPAGLPAVVIPACPATARPRGAVQAGQAARPAPRCGGAPRPESPRHPGPARRSMWSCVRAQVR